MFRYGYITVTMVTRLWKLLYYNQMFRCYIVTGSRGEEITYFIIQIRTCFGMGTLQLQWLQDTGKLLHYGQMLRYYMSDVRCLDKA